MRKMGWNRKRIFATFIMLLGIGVVIFFIACKERAGYHSDYTDTLMWAEASVQSGSIYDPNFWYAYILPFSGNLLMLPFVLLFGVSFTTQVLGMIAFALVFLAAMYGCMKQVGLDYEQRATAVGLCAILLSVSPTARMIFWGHVIHYSMGLLSLWVGMILISKIISDDHVKDKKKQIIYCSLLAIWCFLCCNNGFSAILLFTVPFIGAIVLERFLDVSTPLNDKASLHSLKVGALALFFSGGGLISFYLSQKKIYKSYEDYFTTLLPSSEWGGSNFHMWTTLFTEYQSESVSLVSKDGIQIAYFFLMSIVIFVIPVFALICYKKYENRMMRILVLSHWVIVASLLFTFSISVARGTNWRMCSMLGSAIFLSVVYTMWLIRQEKMKRFGYTLLSALAVFAVVITAQIVTIPSAYGTNVYDRLAEVLKEHDLSYGYGDYWYANAVTILTDSEVKLRSVTVKEDGTCEIYGYQSYPSWYEDQPGIERYFLCITGGEYEVLKDTLVKDSVEVIPFEDTGYILVFDHNLF